MQQAVIDPRGNGIASDKRLPTERYWKVRRFPVANPIRAEHVGKCAPPDALRAPCPSAVDRSPFHPNTPERSRNLWRLRPYLRPHRWRLVLMFSHGHAGRRRQPLRSPRHPVHHRRPGHPPRARPAAPARPCWPSASASARSCWSGSAGGPSPAPSATSRPSLRHDLYVRLQSLPMEFHTRWQSGQLLSRVTTDLSTIRRFMGFGLLFLVINILQLVVVTILLLQLYWPLGIVVLVGRRTDRHRVAEVREEVPGDLPPGAGPAGRPGHPDRGVGASASG